MAMRGSRSPPGFSSLPEPSAGGRPPSAAPGRRGAGAGLDGARRGFAQPPPKPGSAASPPPSPPRNGPSSKSQQPPGGWGCPPPALPHPPSSPSRGAPGYRGTSLCVPPLSTMTGTCPGSPASGGGKGGSQTAGAGGHHRRQQPPLRPRGPEEVKGRRALPLAFR